MQRSYGFSHLSLVFTWLYVLTGWWVWVMTADQSVKRDVVFMMEASPPQPAFIQVFGGQDSEQLCFWIVPKEIWEKGDEAEALNQQIASTLRLYIDANEVKAIEYYYQLSAIMVYDEGGGRSEDVFEGLIGSYGTLMTFCYDITPFKDGIHRAKVSLSSFSNVIYRYEWNFSVGGDHPRN